MIRFQWTKQKRPKRAGRHGGYTRMTFGIIDDVTDARAKEAGGRGDSETRGRKNRSSEAR